MALADYGVTKDDMKKMFNVDELSELMYQDYRFNDDNAPRTPVVCFNLLSTMMLEYIADKIRVAEGKLPMQPSDTEPYDDDGWYNFFVFVRRHENGDPWFHVYFDVESTKADDDAVMYCIDLADDEQPVLCAILDPQCRDAFGKSIEVMLDESKAELDDLLDALEKREAGNEAGNDAGNDAGNGAVPEA